MPLSPHLYQSLNKTNLDVENPNPNGGPNHFPGYQHRQKWSPSNPYLKSHQSSADPNSDFGINGTQVNNNGKNVFKDGTSLDIENPSPLGGPNRSNAGARNIPSGQYTNVGTEGTLFDENGNIVTTMVHQYLPNNKYIDNIDPNNS